MGTWPNGSDAGCPRTGRQRGSPILTRYGRTVCGTLAKRIRRRLPQDGSAERISYPDQVW